MAVLFERNYEMTLGTKTFSSIDPVTQRNRDALRVVFDAQKTDEPEPNKARFRIYNLSKDSRNTLTRSKLDEQTEGTPVLFKAGYQTSLKDIIQGEVTSFFTFQSGPDVITELVVQDGFTRIQTATFEETFEKNTPISTILQALANSLIPGGSSNFSAILDVLNNLVEKGTTFSGSSRDLLTELLKKHKAKWNVQDGKLEVYRPGVPQSTAQTLLLSPQTGLVGIPKKTDSGIDFDTLLIGEIKPGSVVLINSNNFNNQTVLCRSVRYFGDNFGQTWNNQVTGVFLD